MRHSLAPSGQPGMMRKTLCAADFAIVTTQIIHQLLEKVTVLSREKIRVTFRDGREVEQAVDQPKRRRITA